MTVEQETKLYILMKYSSMKDFAAAAGLKYSTVDNIFRRGFNNSTSSNIQAICSTLGISMDRLLQGEVVFVEPKDPPETAELLWEIERFKSVISTPDTYTLDGDMISEEDVRTISDALDGAFELIKKRHKK